MDRYPPIAELVPHRPPMLLVERIVCCDDRSIRCAVEVRPGSPFTQGGRARSVVALEYMAQAAAAWAGWHARSRGEPPRPGLLAHVRRMELATPALEVGRHLIVDVAHTGGEARFRTFEGTVRAADGTEPLVRGTFSVYRGSP